LRKSPGCWLILAGLALAPAQARAATPEAKARAMRVSAALGSCHALYASRLASTAPSMERVVERVMARCQPQENAVRAEVYRDLDPRTAARVMQDQRAHWRRRVSELVVRARSRR
jgi:hypothetical protein